jgi:hypothetical protein
LRLLRQQADIDFIVVFFHHCAYSTTSAHASEGGVRAAWVPLFDEFRVDLVVNGHNHIFERTDPIRGGSPTKGAPSGSVVHPATDGTTYVVVGAGGRALYNFSAPDSYEGHESRVDSINTYSWASDGTRSQETVGWSRVRYTGFAYLAVTATPAPAGRTTTLKVRGISENGTELDVVTLHRRGAQVDRATRGVDQQAGA